MSCSTMWQLRRFFFDSLLKAVGNDVAEESFDEPLGGKKEGNEINFQKSMPRYAQRVFMGAIVDQVSHLMGSNFFLAFWRGPVEGALNLLAVKICFHR